MFRSSLIMSPGNTLCSRQLLKEAGKNSFRAFMFSSLNNTPSHESNNSVQFTQISIMQFQEYHKCRRTVKILNVIPSKTHRLNEKDVALETLLGFRRAGADIIVTYYAKQAARWLNRKD